MVIKSTSNFNVYKYKLNDSKITKEKTEKKRQETENKKKRHLSVARITSLSLPPSLSHTHRRVQGIKKKKTGFDLIAYLWWFLSRNDEREREKTSASAFFPSFFLLSCARHDMATGLVKMKVGQKKRKKKKRETRNLVDIHIHILLISIVHFSVLLASLFLFSLLLLSFSFAL